MFNNLMLAGAIVEGGGILVTHEVEDSRLLYRDLTAFRRCLAELTGQGIGLCHPAPRTDEAVAPWSQ